MGQRRVLGGAQNGGHSGLEKFTVGAAQHLRRAEAQKGKHLGIGVHTVATAQIFHGQQVALALQHGWQQAGEHQVQIRVVGGRGRGGHVRHRGQFGNSELRTATG